MLLIEEIATGSARFRVSVDHIQVWLVKVAWSDESVCLLKSIASCAGAS